MARQSFKAVPLRSVARRPQAARRSPPRRRAGRIGFGPLFVTMPLATFAAVFVWGVPAGEALPLPRAIDRAAETEAARFTLCGSGPRDNCVIDGDTFWYRGEKIRLADINTPETSAPECPSEAALGAQATDRLQALLNAGGFTLQSVDRDRESYGRLLRTATRGGESLGEVMVREGLAEPWRGYRSSWCG